jgi:hypothetical protein
MSSLDFEWSQLSWSEKFLRSLWQSKPLRRYLSTVIGGIMVIGVIGGVTFFLNAYLDSQLLKLALYIGCFILILQQAVEMVLAAAAAWVLILGLLWYAVSTRPQIIDYGY